MSEEALRLMKEKISEQLSSSGLFEYIEPGHEFRTERAGSPLRQDTKRHILARGKDGKDYLILTHHDVMPGKLLAAKLEEASSKNIFLSNVMFRYANSREKDKGPLFKRFYLEHKKDGKYRKIQPALKRSLKNYSFEDKNNLRILTDLERDWVNAMSKGFPAYFQPESARLPEELKIYRFSDVKDIHGTTKESIKYPTEMDSLDNYIIHPMNQNHNKGVIKWNLSSTTGYKFRKGLDIKLADFMQIPGDSTYSRELGEIYYGLKHGADRKTLNSMAKKIGRGNEYLERIIRWHDPKTVTEQQKQGMKDFHEIRLKSKNSEEAFHKLKELHNPYGDDKITCTCESYKYGKDTCKHTIIANEMVRRENS
ncbi:MAG: SWIM zinc finger family protein [Nanobdellota archaeon]